MLSAEDTFAEYGIGEAQPCTAVPADECQPVDGPVNGPDRGQEPKAACRVIPGSKEIEHVSGGTKGRRALADHHVVALLREAEAQAQAGDARTGDQDPHPRPTPRPRSWTPPAARRELDQRVKEHLDLGLLVEAEHGRRGRTTADPHGDEAARTPTGEGVFVRHVVPDVERGLRLQKPPKRGQGMALVAGQGRHHFHDVLAADMPGIGQSRHHGQDGGARGGLLRRLTVMDGYAVGLISSSTPFK